MFDNGYMTSAATDAIDPLAAWSDAVTVLAKLPADVMNLRALDESTLLKLNDLQAQASRYSVQLVQPLPVRWPTGQDRHWG
jgi:hypothetical protein